MCCLLGACSHRAPPPPPPPPPPTHPHPTHHPPPPTHHTPHPATETLTSGPAPFGSKTTMPNVGPHGDDAEWKKFTGRVVLDWSPELEATDSTLVYAS